MNSEEFLARIRELAIEYDIAEGKYPENTYEGRSFYQFCCRKLKIEAIDYDPQEFIRGQTS